MVATFQGSSDFGYFPGLRLELSTDEPSTLEKTINAAPASYGIVTGKGRHSTTARELIVLPGGGMLVDNPGIREVHLWTDETTLRERFAEIEKLRASRRKRQMTGHRHLRRIRQCKSRKHAERNDPDREYERFCAVRRWE